MPDDRDDPHRTLPRRTRRLAPLCPLPLGGRVLTPWALASVARIREEAGIDVEVMWTDDGFVVSVQDTDDTARRRADVAARGRRRTPRGAPARIERALRRALPRDCRARPAAAAPPRRQRAPLWQQRKRAADLLAVAARFGSFPALLETYRECLRDVFDMPALVDVMRQMERATIRVVTVDSQPPSPFASSLLFGYVANFLYDGDAPLAERRAQALRSITRSSRIAGRGGAARPARRGGVETVERQLQHLDERYHARRRRRASTTCCCGSAICRPPRLQARSTHRDAADRARRPRARAPDPARTGRRRRAAASLSKMPHGTATRSASRCRQALPEALLNPFDAARRSPAALRTNARAVHRRRMCGRASVWAPRWWRTHCTAVGQAGASSKASSGLAAAAASGARPTCCARSGSVRSPGCVTKSSRSSRKPLGRLATTWQGVAAAARGLDALLDAIEQLQGAPLPASLLETEILPARVAGYRPGDLDYADGRGGGHVGRRRAAR